MRLEKAIKKIEKALGVEVKETYNGRYSFQYGNQVASFLTQARYDYDDEGNYGPIENEVEVHNWHIRSENDHTDIQTDYFAGYYVDNCTQFINQLKPPAPKFAVGSLVRGKTNKRATRQGYAGKTGLVREIGHYVKIQWMGEEYPSQYNYGYPERDIELVSAAA